MTLKLKDKIAGIALAALLAIIISLMCYNAAHAQADLPDLIIVTSEKGYTPDPSVKFGLLHQHSMQVLNNTLPDEYLESFGFEEGKKVSVLQYSCPIGNRATNNEFGTHHFVLRDSDKVENEYCSHAYKSVLNIKTIRNGKTIWDNNKSCFNIENTNKHVQRDWDMFNNNYGLFNWIGMWEYMPTADKLSCTNCLSPCCADTYDNYALLSNDSVTEDGYVVLKITVNPDKRYAESEYRNNTAFLPVKITNGIAVVDSAAIANNMPHIYTLSFTSTWGNNKTLTLNWTGLADQYDIYDGGVLKATVTGNSYTMPLAASFHEGYYKVVAKNEVGEDYKTLHIVKSQVN